MLPSLIKAEAKLSTGRNIAVDAREREALEVPEGGAGILAALFVGGDRDTDGQWCIVDALAYRDRRGRLAMARPVLLSAAKTQPWLDGLRNHVNELWPRFFQAFLDTANRGHTELVEELGRCHRESTLNERLPVHRVLETEHRATLRSFVEQNGESNAGRLAQDMLAYMLAMAGYQKVTLNPVGVPDFVLEDLRKPDESAAHPMVNITLPRADAARLLELCREAGAEELVRVLAKEMEGSPPRI